MASFVYKTNPAGGSPQLGSESDESLMHQAAHGDRGAFSRIYGKYADVVRTFLLARSGDRDSLDDLMQEVFLRAWIKASAFRNGSSLRTYLLGIAVNVLREDRAAHNRRARLLSKLEPCEPKSGCVESRLMAKEMRDQLDKRIIRLGPKSRQAVELVAIEGLSAAEAAARAGCSTRVLRDRLRRAVAAITP